jgi:Cysteine-rich secretory protein family
MTSRWKVACPSQSKGFATSGALSSSGHVLLHARDPRSDLSRGTAKSRAALPTQEPDAFVIRGIAPAILRPKLLMPPIHRTFVLSLVTIVIGIYRLATAQTEFTGDGSPTGLEEEIRWRVNRGRFDTVSENQLRGTDYADVPDSSGPLAPNQFLTQAARRQSEDMAERNVFQHATVNDSLYYDPVTQPDPWDRMSAEGYVWNIAGENIAAGYYGSDAVYLGWWNSTGHRVNMCNSGLREIGNGYFYESASKFRAYYTMDLGSSGSTRFFTDTLFYDANGDGSFDQAEAVAGVSITLLIGGTPHNYSDLSGSVGNFAVPIQTIARGASVQVVISNTTAGQLQISIPKDYRAYTLLTLTPGQSRVFGSFTQPATVRNVGWRDIIPAPPTVNPTRVVLATSGADMLMSWRSETNLESVIQRSTNLLTWNSVVTNYQAGAATNMTWRDTAASSRNVQTFYRLLIRSR